MTKLSNRAQIKTASLLSICIILSWSYIGSAKDSASQLADYFLNKTAAPDLIRGINLNLAMKIQAQYVQIISKEYGPVIGYKAGLTNSAVQKQFGVPHPLRGTLLKKMLLKNGTAIDAKFGVMPLLEGDLILRVSNDLINQAKNKEEVIQYIDAAIPFIELPDIIYSKDVKINGPALAAINVAARYGIIGDPILVSSSPEWMERLRNFKLRIIDENERVLSEGTGSDLSDHPLNVVLWIKDSLTAEGKRLKKGDLLSLGTITKLMPAQPGTKIRAIYTGLDLGGPVEVSVNFK
jgi:2-keto-4-pentenoate hydratase